MTEVILGVNSAYHESAASLLVDGVLVAAAEEERFSRIKHGKSAAVGTAHELPWNAIAFCLDAAKLTMNEVTQLAYSFDPDRRRRFFGKRPEGGMHGDFGSREGERAFQSSVQMAADCLKSRMPSATVQFVAHHEAHALSAYCCSPFDPAGIVVLDGIGEDSSSWAGVGDAGCLRRVFSIPDPNSIGFLWEKISEFLGFCRYDGPGKVMALAGYGQPGHEEKAFAQFVRCMPDGTFEIDDNVVQCRVPGFQGLERVFGPRHLIESNVQQKANIAYGLQKATETLILHIATALYEEVNKDRTSPIQNLCLAGGVALNCVANGVLLERGPWQRLWIQPAAHDAGTALGSALAARRAGGVGRAHIAFTNAFWGKDISDREAEAALRKSGLSITRPKEMARSVAELLVSGKTVAHVHGKAEFGPRALGNRSLLADPGQAGIKDALNQQIKQREPFRPFAPSLLRSFSGEFCRGRNDAAPLGTEPDHFMTVAIPVNPSIGDSFSSVTHCNFADGTRTSRVHVVEADDGARLREVLEEFGKLTGYPMLLNTSFNVNEPIVNSADDACSTFSQSGVDALALGPYLVTKEG